MAKQFSVYNGAAVTTAAPVAVTTGTSVKTMIQISCSASAAAKVIEWGWEGSASAAATPAVVELLFHTTGAATMTQAYAAADIKKYDPNSAASLITLGTANSGFTASSEGTVATPTGNMVHQISPTTGMYFQYQYGREPEIILSGFCRLRNTITPAVNAICLVAWEE